MPAPRPLLFIHKVVPGSTTYTSGSGSFKVPNYNRLAIKAWGGGAGGGSCTFNSVGGSVTRANGISGGNTTASAGFSIAAHGGGYGFGSYGSSGSYHPGAGGAAGAASGANTINTNGTAGTAGSSSTGGAGGAGASGGAGGAGFRAGPVAAQNGGAPGGGGGGGVGAGSVFEGSGGGSGGAYCYSLFGPGVSAAPAPGTIISWSVGPGGAGGTYTNTSTGGNATFNGGAGARGQINFTWS